MASSSIVRCTFVFALVAAGAVGSGIAQSSTAGTSLSLEEVVSDVKEGIPEELIITKIRKSGRAFKLSREEIRELTNSGISLTVIRYLVDPSLPYSAPPPPVAAPVAPPPVAAVPAEPAPPRTPPRIYPADSHASDVPADPGLYRFVDDAPVKTEIKLLLGENQGAGIGKVVLRKGKAVGYLLGPMANTRIGETAPVFYLRLPEGKAIEEVVLLALARTKERREVEIGPSLEKQELKSESMRRFDALEVGQHLFKITPSIKLAMGEYLFLLLGSAEPPKGSYGKVYDFSIQASRK